MSVSPKQEPYLLPGIENQLLFTEEILPTAFDETAPAATPKAVFLGGQSGSGKSGLSAFILKTFPREAQAVVVNSDALREYHPAFPALQETDVNQASFLVNPDTVKWQQQLITAAVDTKRNLILDGTLGGNPAPIRETIQMLRRAGYQIQLSILAVPARLSRLGIYKRYEDQMALKGMERWVGMENHDRLYDEIPRTLALLESEKVIDQIQIFGRPTSLSTPPLLYENQLTNSDWREPSTAVQSLADGRNRRWSTNEQVAFRQVAQSIGEQMSQRGASLTDITAFFRYVDLSALTHRSAQPADSRLYLDWANDPDTRRQSFNSNPISPETHTAWFTRKLADPNALLLVFGNEVGEAVGQVRFERTPVADLPDEITIGMSVGTKYRGQGLASQLIEQGCAACREQWGAVAVHAYIKPDNQASVRAFERAGFKLSGESGKFGVPSMVYILKA